MSATELNLSQTPSYPVSDDPLRTVLGERRGLRVPVCQAGMGRVSARNW